MSLDQYDGVANVTSCAVPECAASYYEDVSFAFNNVDDNVLGCTSGITVWKVKSTNIDYSHFF